MNPTADATTIAPTTAGDVARNLSLVRDEITETSAKIDAGELAGLAGHLSQGGRVFVAGAGRSGLVLRMAAMRLMHLGLTVHVAGDTTTPAISERDLLLVASGSGTTAGVVKSAETAVKAGARIAAFTTNAQSPLAGLADALVIIPAAQKTDHGRDGEQHDRDEEDQLCDFDSGAGDAAKAEQSRDERDNEKSDSPTEHGVTSLKFKISLQPMTFKQR